MRKAGRSGRATELPEIELSIGGRNILLSSPLFTEQSYPSIKAQLQQLPSRLKLDLGRGLGKLSTDPVSCHSDPLQSSDYLRSKRSVLYFARPQTDYATHQFTCDRLPKYLAGYDSSMIRDADTPLGAVRIDVMVPRVWVEETLSLLTIIKNRNHVCIPHLHAPGNQNLTTPTPTSMRCTDPPRHLATRLNSL